MTGYELGDLVLVPFPFADLTGIKKRPAVIVSTAEYHRQRRDIIIMAVTSQFRPTAGDVPVAEWEAAGLIKPSVLKPVLATIARDRIIRRLGRLGPRDRNALLALLRSIVGE